MVTDEELIQALKACPLSVSQLADRCTVSRPTVERGLMGKNLPHQTIRQTIVNLLKRLEK
jgi:hypothetical protein